MGRHIKPLVLSTQRECLTIQRCQEVKLTGNSLASQDLPKDFDMNVIKQQTIYAVELKMNDVAKS